MKKSLALALLSASVFAQSTDYPSGTPSPLETSTDVFTETPYPVVVEASSVTVPEQQTFTIVAVDTTTPATYANDPTLTSIVSFSSTGTTVSTVTASATATDDAVVTVIATRTWISYCGCPGVHLAPTDGAAGFWDVWATSTSPATQTQNEYGNGGWNAWSGSTVTATATATVTSSTLVGASYVTVTDSITGSYNGFTTITRAQPSGTAPGTVEISAVLTGTSSTVTGSYVTIIDTPTGSYNGFVTITLVQPSGTVPGTVEVRPTLTSTSTTSSSTISSTTLTSINTSSSTSTSSTSSTSTTSTSTTSTSTSSTSTTSSTTSSTTTSSSTITTTTTSSSSTTTTTSSTTTTSQAPVVTDEAYIDTILRHHNVHRANSSAVNMVWSPSLADTARITAQNCVYQHDTTTNGGGYGQNIGAGFPSNMMGVFVTEGLYNPEEPNYTAYGSEPDYNQLDSWGHFTQIVWKASTSVGCYTADCSSSGLQNAPGIPPYFTVCNYAPAGNVVGGFAANVGQPLGAASIDASYECGVRTNCVGPTQ